VGELAKAENERYRAPTKRLKIQENEEENVSLKARKREEEIDHSVKQIERIETTRELKGLGGR